MPSAKPQLNVRVDQDLKEAVELKAKLAGVTVNTYVVRVLREATGQNPHDDSQAAIIRALNQGSGAKEFKGPDFKPTKGKK